MIELIKPREVSWETTFSSKSSMPYGTLVISEMLPQLFPGKEVNINNKNYYETDPENNSNIVIINNNFYCDEYSTYALLDFVVDGGNLFISAFDFNYIILDTLKLTVSSEWARDGHNFNFINEELKSSRDYHIEYQYSSFFTLDSCTNCTPISKFSNGNINFVQIKFGNGNIYLNSNPLAFTNYHILKGNVIDYAEKSLSMLTVTDVIWDEYQRNRLTNNMSALQFISNNPPLLVAYYIGLLLLILFVILFGKRRQRLIPVIEPLKNNSLEFAETISQLYLQQKNHKDIVNKRILYFFDHLYHRYNIKDRDLNDELIKKLAVRTSKNEGEIRKLISTLKKCSTAGKVSDSDLIDLNKKLENFYQ